ncbi:MAG: hypothetical protein C4567_17965 [Deltaproteobacteria bacterium]|nr:MAG: hypothetical protein C4567_17965 [Deltaproteobacteria bacterium]
MSILKSGNKILGLLLVLAFVAVVGLVLPSAASAGSGKWTKMDCPTEKGISAVWGSSSSDVFAVAGGNIILHYDGTSWTSTPAPEGAVGLRDIWGSSGNDVFAIGNNWKTDKGIILHYDGISWSLMDHPIDIGDHGYTKAIWGSAGNDVFIGTETGGYIFHYNGSTWKQMYQVPPSPFGYGDEVNGIWGSSSSDVFVVTALGFIYHYDGSNWSKMFKCTDEYGEGIFLFDVWGSSGSDVFVGGYCGSIFHYDGEEWRRMDTPVNSPEGEDRYELFTDIWGSSPSDLFVLAICNWQCENEYTVILHYNGTSWSAMEIPEEASKYLNDVWGSSAHDVFVVGRAGTILHYDGPAAVDYTLTVNVDPAGSGTVELDPPGGTYPAGTIVTLAAYAAEGYAFDHWSGDLSGSANPAAITMDANKNVTAHFVPALPDLTITALNLPADVYKGSPVTVNATVYNSGKAGAESFSVAIYVYTGDSATLVDTKSVSSLAYGSGTDVDFTWTPAAAGQVTLKAIADSGNAITELNETNNELTKETTVTEKSVMNISPADKTVTVGETFTLDVVVTPAVVIAGAQFDLSFDPSVMEVTYVAEGNLLKQGVTSTYFQAGVIDNPNGKLTGVAGAITTPGAEVSGAGTFATVTFKAKAQGSTNLALSNVVVGNKAGQAVAVAVTGGSVAVTAPSPGGGGGGGGGAIPSTPVEQVNPGEVPVAGPPTEVGISFLDLPAGHWAREVIEFMAAKGFLKGYPDGTCRPDQPGNQGGICGYAGARAGASGSSRRSYLHRRSAGRLALPGHRQRFPPRPGQGLQRQHLRPR